MPIIQELPDEEVKNTEEENRREFANRRQRRIIKTLVIDEVVDAKQLASIEADILSLYKKYTEALPETEKTSGLYEPKKEIYKTPDELKQSDYFKNSPQVEQEKMIDDFKPKQVIKLTFKTKEDAEVFINQLIEILKSKGIKFKVIEAVDSKNDVNANNENPNPEAPRSGMRR